MTGMGCRGVPKLFFFFFEKGKMRIPGNNFKKIDFYCFNCVCIHMKTDVPGDPVASEGAGN